MLRTGTCVLLIAFGASGCRLVERSHWRSRSDFNHCVSATFHVLIERTDTSVELDGILVADLPDNLRIRLSKLSQSVLDLTRTPNGIWIDKRNSGDAETVFAPADAAHLQEAVPLLVRGLYLAKKHGNSKQLKKDTRSGQAECRVDSEEGRVSQCNWHTKENKTFTLSFRAYTSIGGVDWPNTIVGESPSGRFTLTFDEVEFDQPLAARAFTPPRRAEKIR